jgi:hypothetical protein
LIYDGDPFSHGRAHPFFFLDFAVEVHYTQKRKELQEGEQKKARMFHVKRVGRNLLHFASGFAESSISANSFLLSPQKLRTAFVGLQRANQSSQGK